MNALWQDIRYGVRMLRRAPGFTAIALVTLAIGIGANTIMFSVVNMLLFRPTQVKDSEKLVCCKIRNFRIGIPYPIYRTLAESNPVFSDLMVQDDGLGSVTLAHGETAKQVCGMFVSSNYFSFLGAAPALGRGFLPAEERPDSAPVAVLSHRAWQRLGGDPEIVGQSVRVNGVPCEVVGVAPEGFTGLTHLGPDLWLPTGSFLRVVRLSRGEARPGMAASDWYRYPGVFPVGRLRPGLNMAAAEAQLQALVPQFKEKYPRRWKGDSAFYLHRPPPFSIMNDQGERSGLAGFSVILMGVSGAVLLIACLNLASMMIVHGAGRRREIAVRLALGGGRLRIVRQLLIESGLLAVFGGVLGLVLAFWGMRVLNAWIVAAQMPIDLGAALGIALDGRVLTVTLGFCLLAALLFGLRPALGLSRRDVVTDLKESSSVMLQPRRRRRGRLSTVCQVALAVVLVMGAALFTRGAVKALRPNGDFDFDGKLVVKLDTFAGGYDLARSQQVYETLADHVRSLPGIQTVSLSASFPLAEGGGYGGTVREYKPGKEDDKRRDVHERSPRPVKGAPHVHTVGADYFGAMDMPLLQGRSFRRLDSVPDAEKVVIIDERIARRLRPDGNALGCLITYGRQETVGRVVGIVPTLQIATDNEVPSPQIYLPMGSDSRPVFVHLRVADTMRETETVLLDRIRAAIRETDPHLPIVSLTNLADCHRSNPFVWTATMGARLAVIFGAMALFLASLGIYAVKGYMVASRTSEIGIRKALGATHKDIMGMVFREGSVLTVAGLAVGLLLGLGVARLIASMLYGVDPVDPISIVATIALLGVASLLAGYVPARRAARIDPMEALRHE